MSSYVLSEIDLLLSKVNVELSNVSIKMSSVPVKSRPNYLPRIGILLSTLESLVLSSSSSSVSSSSSSNLSWDKEYDFPVFGDDTTEDDMSYDNMFCSSSIINDTAADNSTEDDSGESKEYLGQVGDRSDHAMGAEEIRRRCKSPVSSAMFRESPVSSAMFPWIAMARP